MTKGKTVFFVGNTSWSLINFRTNVIRFFIEKGCRVCCVAPPDEYAENFEKIGAEFIPITIDARGTNPLQDIVFFTKLYKIYKQYRPDFVFHYTIKPNIYGSIACSLFKIPCISIVSGIGFVFLKRNLLFNIVKPLYKYASSKTLEVWFLNKEDQVFFHDEGIVRDDKVKVLPGEGIHVEHFTRSKPYSDLPDSPFTFLFSARLLWEKGIGYYVHAAKKLKLEFEHVKFLVIGFYDVGNKHAVQPEDMAIWEKAAIIQYLGAVKDVRTTLEQTNCLVFPSYYKEGVPRVLLEAASMEIPIITTDNVGCREIIRDNENGLICKTKDEDSLYEKMKAMILMSKEMRTKMGSEGRKLILKNYDEKLVISYYAHVFNDYIEKD